MKPSSPAATPTALVVAAHGRRGLVEIDGARRPFVPRGRGLRIVCGDRVRYEDMPGADSVLATAIEPRHNTLARAGDRGEEILAANLTQVIVVCAPTPEPDFLLIDRYLCAAELMDCKAVLAWNKSDIAPATNAALTEYRRIGYSTIEVSTRTAASLAPLRDALEGQVSALVGQSGVGKSSLVNALVPDGRAVIGELSAALESGTHTTTAVLMYPIGRDGKLLDTPGVRDFVPALKRDRDVALGFPELHALADGCRFADCSHAHEPGCAVKAALEEGRVDRRRYDSYRRLRNAVVDAGAAR